MPYHRRRSHKRRRGSARRVGRVMRSKVKAVVRSMEFTKMERELALDGAMIPIRKTGEISQQQDWVRLIPKVLIGFLGDERPYATVKPLKLQIDLRVGWALNYQIPIDLTVVVYVLTAKNLKKYALPEYNATGFPNWGDFLQADGKTSQSFTGFTANECQLYFASNFPVNQNCHLIKKFKFRMVKGPGVPWGMLNLPVTTAGFQPALASGAVANAPESGPFQMLPQQICKRFSVPLPSVLRYELQTNANGLTDADKFFPVNYAPVMAIGYYDNATGTVWPTTDDVGPLSYNYTMKLTYKDL